MSDDNSPGLGGQHPHSGDEPCLGGDDWQGDICDQCGKHIMESDKDYICDDDGMIWFCSEKCAKESWNDYWDWMSIP